MNKFNKIAILLASLAMLIPAVVSAYDISVTNKTGANVKVTLDYAGGPACPSSNFTLLSSEAAGGYMKENKGACCLSKVRAVNTENGKVTAHRYESCGDKSFKLDGSQTELIIRP
jgi:hypothetical protein